MAENNNILKDFNKDAAYKKELKKLKEIFKEVNEDKKNLCAGLIEEASYMRATLQELRLYISRDGAIQWFEQGNNRFYRESPGTKSYTALINRYSSIIKQLFDLMPEDKEGNKDENKDELTEFIKRGGSV